MNDMKLAVQSIHLSKSVIQTIYDFAKAHGGVPIPIAIGTIRMKGIKMEVNGTDFTIQLTLKS